jgi:hypothetical protein
MIYWLAQAAKQLRKQTTPTTKQVEIAATVGGIDQSTIYRFEQGQAWPRQTDTVVAAYAEELGLDGRDIWDLALTLWREHGEAPTVPRAERETVSPADAIEQARKAFAQSPGAGDQDPAEKPRRRQTQRSATGRRRAAG